MEPGGSPWLLETGTESAGMGDLFSMGASMGAQHIALAGSLVLNSAVQDNDNNG